MKELEDDPDVPLFFGRLDYLEPADETFHIGRRHVNDEQGEPLVVDWRADISVPFYRASKTEPMGVGVRRRFGFTHGEMTAFEDEDLTTLGAGRASTATSWTPRSSARVPARCATSSRRSSRSRT